MSKTIIEKLGIPAVSFEAEYDEVDDISTEANNVWMATIADRKMTRLFLYSREMLEALIDNADNEEIEYQYVPFQDIIEKATGKTWPEIKELLNEN